MDRNRTAGERALKHKKRGKWACALCLSLSLLLSAQGGTVVAHAVSQSDIDALEAKKEEIGLRVEAAQKRLELLQDAQADVLELAATLNIELRSANEALTIVEEQIDSYDAIIEEKTQELGIAQTREQNQLNRYRTRVRAMEESDGYNILAILLQAGSLRDLLAAVDDYGDIMDSDKQLDREYRAAREELEEVKADYEEVRAVCEEKKTELESEKGQLEARISEAETELEGLADQIEEAEILYEEAVAAEEKAAAEVEQLIAQYEEQKRLAAMASAGAVQGGGAAPASSAAGAMSFDGVFMWPVPSGNTITGVYGEQRSGHVHSGIDIDGYGCDGSPIVAAAAGTVITSTSSDGYGIYVMIDHGNGYVTLYAHMSGAAVSAGQTVSQGQTIGYLGATGNATGTHCHFEVRINGATTDPEAWFPGCPHWNC